MTNVLEVRGQVLFQHFANTVGGDGATADRIHGMGHAGIVFAFFDLDGNKLSLIIEDFLVDKLVLEGVGIDFRAQTRRFSFVIKNGRTQGVAIFVQSQVTPNGSPQTDPGCLKEVGGAALGVLVNIHGVTNLVPGIFGAEFFLQGQIQAYGFSPGNNLTVLINHN